MSLKTIIVDFDNTIADTASRIKDYYPNYEPSTQKSYIFSGEFANAIELYGKQDFYNPSKLLFNWQVVNFIKEECEKEPTRIIFISSCMNKETVKSKVDFLELFSDNHFVKAVEINYELIREGNVSVDVVYEYFGLHNLEHEVIAIDDYEKRLRDYVGLGDNRPSIIAVEHPYSKGYIMYMSRYMTNILLPNYLHTEREN